MMELILLLLELRQSFQLSLQLLLVTNKSEIGTGIYHLILSRKFLVSMCFLHKIMSILNRLSKIIQEDDIAWISLT